MNVVRIAVIPGDGIGKEFVPGGFTSCRRRHRVSDLLFSVVDVGGAVAEVVGLAER
jgi:isocitrate/isopropylmalate dehydrogenase